MVSGLRRHLTVVLSIFFWLWITFSLILFIDPLLHTDESEGISAGESHHLREVKEKLYSLQLENEQLKKQKETLSNQVFAQQTELQQVHLSADNLKRQLLSGFNSSTQERLV